MNEEGTEEQGSMPDDVREQAQRPVSAVSETVGLPAELLNLDEFEAAARDLLPREVYDYYAGGAEDEQTIKANRAAFARYVLRPRVLVDVSKVDTQIELFGTVVRAPVLIAPTAFHRLAHPDGEIATARAAAAQGSIYVASTVSTTAIEDIAAAAPDTALWFQLYVFRDRGITRSLVERAQAAGCKALCLTVTVPVQGKRERDVRNRFGVPPNVELANFRGLQQARMPRSTGSSLEYFIAREFDPTLDWHAVEWLASVTTLPILIKGVAHPDDARKAMEHGAQGLIVSNHGGRQLDCAIATLDALPDIVETVADRIPVLIDGGVRRGTDVIKALALGAQATLIGRPVLWGLAAAGEAGVGAVLGLLQNEVVRSLALCGLRSVREITTELIRPA
jgi:4-hydroxymandelate oxidase